MLLNSLFLPTNAGNASSGLSDSSKMGAAGYLFADIMKVSIDAAPDTSLTNSADSSLGDSALSTIDFSQLLTLIQSLIGGQQNELIKDSESMLENSIIGGETTISLEELNSILQTLVMQNNMTIVDPATNLIVEGELPSLNEIQNILNNNKAIMLTVQTGDATVNIDLKKIDTSHPSGTVIPEIQSNIVNDEKYSALINIMKDEGNTDAVSPIIEVKQELSNDNLIVQKETATPKVSFIIHEPQIIDESKVHNSLIVNQMKSLSNEDLQLLKSINADNTKLNQSEISKLSKSLISEGKTILSEKVISEGKTILSEEILSESKTTSNEIKTAISEVKVIENETPVTEKAILGSNYNEKLELNSETEVELKPVIKNANTILSSDSIKENVNVSSEGEVNVDEVTNNLSKENFNKQKIVNGETVNTEIENNPVVLEDVKVTIPKETPKQNNINTDPVIKMTTEKVETDNKTESKENLSAQMESEKQSIKTENESKQFNFDERSVSREQNFKSNFSFQEDNKKFSEILNEKTQEAFFAKSDPSRVLRISQIVKELTNVLQTQDRNSITLKLEPEHLGEVKIHLDVKENSVKASIQVENEMVKKVVENNLKELQSSMSRNGIQLESLNISLQNAEQKNAKHSSNKKKHSGVEDETDFIEVVDENNFAHKNLGYNTVEYLA